MTKDQIRDVIAQWRARIAKCRHISENQAALGNTWLARSWDEEADTIADCVRQLEALLTGVWICKIDGTHHRDGPCDCAALAERPQPQEAQNEMVDCDSVRPADAGDARVGVVGDVARDAFREGFAAGRHQAQQIARDRPLVAKEDAMTQQSDRERLDAIQQKVDAGCCGAMYLDVQFLLDRLAALEHENVQLKAGEGLRRDLELQVDYEHAEAALLSLQRERNELQAELTGTLSEAFQAIPACYDTPADHYREMARRLVEDRDVQKHRARHAEAALLSLQTELRAVVNAAGRATSCIHELDIYSKGIAALLPDPAGTTAPKNDDALARVDRRG